MPLSRTVFMNFAPTANQFCEQVAQAMLREGIHLTLDHWESQEDDLLPPTIEQDLKHASAFVFIMTPEMLQSQRMHREQRAFREEMIRYPERRMLCVRVAPCYIPDLPTTSIYIDALHCTADQAIANIVHALEEHVESKTETSHPDLKSREDRTENTDESDICFSLPDALRQLGFREWMTQDRSAIVPPMCLIPAGPFMMGSDPLHDSEAFDDEFSQHSVLLPRYEIGKYPVTVAEYACAVRAGVLPTPCMFEWKGGKMTWKMQLHLFDHPVVCVAWDECLVYANWLSSVTGQHWCLQSEAEWEKAARWQSERGESTIYPWGDLWDDSRANVVSTGTTPVGAFAAFDDASPYGLHDMAGNIWEWTSSAFHAYPYAPAVEQESDNPLQLRTVRGGFWGGSARYTRAAYRRKNYPIDANSGKGFRLVIRQG